MTTLDLMASGKAAGERLDRWTRVLCVLFFFSGFPALIYQLTWQRALFRVFGVNVESVTIVVTAFLLGLGLGSLVGGWLSQRRNVPLLPLLAAIELMTGAFGLASLRIFDFVGDLTIGLPLAVMAAAALAVVIVPTLLMGATLPLLVGHLARRSGHVGSAVGLLYYVNTLGAGAACLACMALLFPFLGMQGAVYVAVAINGRRGGGALAVHWRDRGDPITPRRRRPQYWPASPGAPPLLSLAAAGGFVALSYEIFFFRTVSYATGSSSSAFAATLSAFLIGLASGSRQAGENCSVDAGWRHAPRVGRPDEGQSRRPSVPAAARALGLARSRHRRCGHSDGLPGGSFLGRAAPLSGRARRRRGRPCRHAHRLLYLANILGSAAGSIITGFVLMEHLGLVGIGTALVVAGLVCAVLLIGALSMPRPEKFCEPAGAMGRSRCSRSRRSTNVLENLQWKGAPSAMPLVQVVENRSGIIAVTADGIVFGNGMYDGHFNTDLMHDTNGIVRPYALSLFHPAPRDVLMIGLASGLVGAGHRQQSRCRLAHHRGDQSRLSRVDRNGAGSSLGAEQPQGHHRGR